MANNEMLFCNLNLCGIFTPTWFDNSFPSQQIAHTKPAAIVYIIIIRDTSA
jgi:hypothetical protein